jgi:magnesium chelatase subunit D
VLSLLLDAYQKRDRVALVAFRGEDADVLLPPTGSVELAYKLLEELPTGGKTPLSHGMAMGYQVLDNVLRKDPDICPLMILISDGKANVSLSGGKPSPESMDIAQKIGEDGRIRAIVIDVENKGLVNFGLAAALSARMGGSYYRIDDLKSDTIVEILKQETINIDSN